MDGGLMDHAAVQLQSLLRLRAREQQQIHWSAWLAQAPAQAIQHLKAVVLGKPVIRHRDQQAHLRLRDLLALVEHLELAPIGAQAQALINWLR